MAENKDYKFVDHYEFDEELLKKAFAEARKIYKERGFMRKMGFGKAPAITTVDMARAWMSEGHPFTCDHSEEVCANALKVLEAGRKSGVPIFHTTTGYIGKQQWDLPRWDEKIPMSAERQQAIRFSQGAFRRGEGDRVPGELNQTHFNLNTHQQKLDNRIAYRRCLNWKYRPCLASSSA